MPRPLPAWLAAFVISALWGALVDLRHGQSSAFLLRLMVVPLLAMGASALYHRFNRPPAAK